MTLPVHKLVPALVLVACTAASSARGVEAPYVGHPRLTFSASDIEVLRDRLGDGGEDDLAYDAIRSWCIVSLVAPPSTLLGTWEGFNTVPQFGLAAWIEPDGSPYAAQARAAALEIARHRPPSSDEFTTALRLYVMALAYDQAFGGATAGERDEVRTAMRTFLDYMPVHFNFYSQAYNPYTGNHGMTVGAAMGLAAIALWDDVAPSGRDSLQASMQFADQLVGKVMTDILPADGAYREGVLYDAWSMRVAIPWFEARRRFDGTDLVTDSRVERSLEWLCYELAPDGTGRTNNLNDSAWSTRPLALHGTLLEWAQARYANPLARYLHTHVVGTYGFDYGPYADRVAVALWNRMIAPANPATRLPSGRVFPNRGLYYYRNGWKTGATGDEVVFSFFSGPFFGGHAQEDQNQITLAAYGKRWVVDCGPVASQSTPKQTEAHNLVLCDGLGQHNAGNSIGTDGQIAASIVSGFADYVRGDAMAAYATYSPFNAPGVPFSFSDWSWGYDGGNPMQRASRSCLVLKGSGAPPWMLIGDDMRKNAATHDWDWLLHTDQSHAVDLDADPAVLSSGSTALDIYFAHPRPASLQLSAAPFASAGVDPATRRIVARANTVEPRFCIALVPRGPAVASPTYSCVDDGQATTVTLDWGTVRDDAVFSAHGSPGTGAIVTDGRMAAVRRAGTALRGWVMGEGTALALDGLALVTLPESGCAAWDGDSLYVTTPTFSAWAPGVRGVHGPTGPILFRQDGDRVRNLEPTAIGPGGPGGFLLQPPDPNPMHGTTALRLRLDHRTHVLLRIHDARGRRVATVVDATLTAGPHVFTWDGRDVQGRQAPSGVYFAVVVTPESQLAHKLVLLP